MTIVDVPFNYDIGIPTIPDDIKQRVRAGESITIRIIAGSGFAQNALKHGVAGLNVDGSRVPLDGDYKCGANGRPSQTGLGDKYDSQTANRHSEVGRWPANLLHDGSDEVVRGFPETKSGNLSPHHKLRASNNRAMSGPNQERNPRNEFGGDSGSAARFFYVCKSDSAERAIGGVKNTHPTVKPVDLCAYLAKLILPPERNTPRRLLVPFSGSGSEIMGALRADWDEVVGIEGEKKWVELSRERIHGDAPMFNVEAT